MEKRDNEVNSIGTIIFRRNKIYLNHSHKLDELTKGREVISISYI